MFKYFVISLIELYQIYFSRDHSFWRTKNTRRICKMQPSCSQFTKEQILKYGGIKGMYLGWKRIRICGKGI